MTAVDEIEKTAASPFRPSIDRPTPTRAEMSGMPAASSEQRAIVKTIRATIRPISSVELEPPDELEKAGPPTSIVSVLDSPDLVMSCKRAERVGVQPR